MSEATQDTVQLISGLITHMKQIVGDGACYAMLHYGAMEEGKRFGSAYAENDVPHALERIDSILMQKSEVVTDDGAVVTIRITASPLLQTGQRAVQGIILGLMEGALTATRKARYKGAVLQSGTPNELLIELKKEG